MLSILTLYDSCVLSSRAALFARLRKHTLITEVGKQVNKAAHVHGRALIVAYTTEHYPYPLPPNKFHHLVLSLSWYIRVGDDHFHLLPCRFCIHAGNCIVRDRSRNMGHKGRSRRDNVAVKSNGSLIRRGEHDHKQVSYHNTKCLPKKNLASCYLSNPSLDNDSSILLASSSFPSAMNYCAEECEDSALCVRENTHKHSNNQQRTINVNEQLLTRKEQSQQ